MSNTPPLPPQQALPLTPELVQQLAERVYAMWLKECQIENERRRLVERWRATPNHR